MYVTHCWVRWSSHFSPPVTFQLQAIMQLPKPNTHCGGFFYVPKIFRVGFTPHVNDGIAPIGSTHRWRGPKLSLSLSKGLCGWYYFLPTAPPPIMLISLSKMKQNKWKWTTWSNRSLSFALIATISSHKMDGMSYLAQHNPCFHMERRVVLQIPHAPMRGQFDMIIFFNYNVWYNQCLVNSHMPFSYIKLITAILWEHNLSVPVLFMFEWWYMDTPPPFPHLISMKWEVWDGCRVGVHESLVFMF